MTEQTPRTTEERTPDCRDGHDFRLTTDFDGEPIRCVRCKAVPEREAAAATPSLPLDARRLRYALLDLAGLDYAYEARLDSGDYGLLERPTEFADRITEAYSALSASSEPSKGEVDG